MAFSSLVLFLIETQFTKRFTRKEKEDYCHLWRYLGFLLGIEDEFNIARDFETAEAVRREYFKLTPWITTHVSDESIRLAKSSLHGFGVYTFASLDFFTVVYFSPQLILGESFPVDPKWSEIVPPTAAYAKKVLARWKRYETSKLGKLINTIVINIVHVQATMPFVATVIETIASYWPQRWKM